jgi:hypothetical protein
MDVAGSFGDWYQRWFASVLRFCTISREVELVAVAGETPKTHALEAMGYLEVCETHLHLLALIPRLFKFGSVL